MIHSASPQARPAGLVAWFWDGRTERRSMWENSDHYRPGLWSASWINKFNFSTFRGLEDDVRFISCFEEQKVFIDNPTRSVNEAGGGGMRNTTRLPPSGFPFFGGITMYIARGIREKKENQKSSLARWRSRDSLGTLTSKRKRGICWGENRNDEFLQLAIGDKICSLYEQLFSFLSL